MGLDDDGGAGRQGAGEGGEAKLILFVLFLTTLIDDSVLLSKAVPFSEAAPSSEAMLSSAMAAGAAAAPWEEEGRRHFRQALPVARSRPEGSPRDCHLNHSERTSSCDPPRGCAACKLSWRGS